MNTVTIQVSDDRVVKLQETASHLGVSIEELVLMGIEQLVKQPEASFQDPIGYVLKKNAELYKRLA